MRRQSRLNRSVALGLATVSLAGYVFWQNGTGVSLPVLQADHAIAPTQTTATLLTPRIHGSANPSTAAQPVRRASFVGGSAAIRTVSNAPQDQAATYPQIVPRAVASQESVLDVEASSESSTQPSTDQTKPEATTTRSSRRQARSRQAAQARAAYMTDSVMADSELQPPAPFDSSPVLSRQTASPPTRSPLPAATHPASSQTPDTVQATGVSVTDIATQAYYNSSMRVEDTPPLPARTPALPATPVRSVERQTTALYAAPALAAPSYEAPGYAAPTQFEKTLANRPQATLSARGYSPSQSQMSDASRIAQSVFGTQILQNQAPSAPQVEPNPAVQIIDQQIADGFAPVDAAAQLPPSIVNDAGQNIPRQTASNQPTQSPSVPPIPLFEAPGQDAQYPTPQHIDSQSDNIIHAFPESTNPDRSVQGPAPVVTDAATPGSITQQNHGYPSGHHFSPGRSGFRATVETDAPRWLNPYQQRTARLSNGELQGLTPSSNFQMPMDFLPWWDSLVRNQMGIAPSAMPVDATSLVQKAMQHSPQILALQTEPEVQQRIVWQEEAQFDWRTFLETTYDDLNDPVGNTLTTGDNSDRFSDTRVNANGGLRKKTTSGGELQISQRIGHQYNNSTFLIPNPQSTSRLELSFRQPIWSKAGTVYNQSQIVLARIATNSSSDEVLNELQAHLYQVTEAYWQLYRGRAEFFQRQKLLESAQSVLHTLEGRDQVDTIPRQILRARAAVARAEARMQRAVTAIRNTESQLRLLVNDPVMLNQGPVEFTPVETPAMMPLTPALPDSLNTALINRPDISKAIRQMRASGVRLGVSRNEMLPRLDFLVKSYVAGLHAHNGVPESIGNQFTEGRPGFTVGLEFEVPLGNRAARARVEQRQWELQRSINVFRATVEASLTEVEVSNREVETAFRELQGRFQAMNAAQNETNYLKDRFEVLPASEDSAILLLEDLLDGFERLADEEAAFVDAQVKYALSIIELRRATGVLLKSRHDQPKISSQYSEWMTQRIEETTGESMDTDAFASAAADPASETADFSRQFDTQPQVRTTLDLSDPDSTTAPGSWARPVGQRPVGQRPAQGTSSREGSLSAPKPGRQTSQSAAGGHSLLGSSR